MHTQASPSIPPLPGAIEVGAAPPGFAGYDALLDLVQRAFAGHAGRIDPPSSADRATAASLRELAQHGVLILATEVGAVGTARLVGCVFGTPQGEALYLGKLAVDPDWRGRGIARRLVAALCEHARAEAYASVTLGVRLALTENIRLFERLGFVATRVRCHPGFTTPTSQDMALALASSAAQALPGEDPSRGPAPR